MTESIVAVTEESTVAYGAVRLSPDGSQLAWYRPESDDDTHPWLTVSEDPFLGVEHGWVTEDVVAGWVPLDDHEAAQADDAHLAATAIQARGVVAARIADLERAGADTVTLADFAELIETGIRSRAWFRKELLRLVARGRLTDQGRGVFGVVPTDPDDDQAGEAARPDDVVDPDDPATAAALATPVRHPDDAALISEIRALIEVADPVPTGLDQRVTDALTSQDGGEPR